VCVFMYVYVYVCVCMYVCMHVCMYLCMYVSMYAFTHKNTKYICMHACMTLHITLLRTVDEILVMFKSTSFSVSLLFSVSLSLRNNALIRSRTVVFPAPSSPIKTVPQTNRIIIVIFWTPSTCISFCRHIFFGCAGHHYFGLDPQRKSVLPTPPKPSSTVLQTAIFIVIFKFKHFQFPLV
jgi:hypothetical protein